MNRLFSRKLSALVIGIVLPLAVWALPSKPQPPRLVNDLAGIFTPTQVYALETALVEFDDSTSNQIAVVTVNDLEGYEPDEYATRLGIEWKVGSAEFNNGIVVLVKPKTASSGGRVAISVGYGLEGAIPDAYAKRIIENEMIPSFKEGDYYAGVEKACIILMKLAKGEYDYAGEDNDEEIGLMIFGILIICFIIFIFILIIAGKKGGGGGGSSGNSGGGLDDFTKGVIIGNILNNPGKSSRGSYGGFGGGSFGRGGFGGFGGGSFGGGGAKGSW